MNGMGSLTIQFSFLSTLSFINFKNQLEHIDTKLGFKWINEQRYAIGFEGPNFRLNQSKLNQLFVSIENRFTIIAFIQKHSVGFYVIFE